MTRLFTASLLSTLILTGCPAPQCEVGQTRCNGDLAEICDSARQWSYRSDCEFVDQNSEGVWACVEGTCLEMDPE